LKTILTALFLSAALLAQGKSWQIPDGAADEHNPLAATPDVLKKGAALYKSHCQGCHGATGLGDGPEADLKDAARRPANLSVSRTRDGVMFYKIWNGRQEPKMPDFKSQMTKTEAWAVVAYVTSSLRVSPPGAASP
jgi:mono/diheme cytochrome c family protein